MNNDVLTAIWGKNSKQHGETPSVALINPKKADNVAKIVRLASCYGFKQVWWTGHRVELDLQSKKKLPREERMKGYQEVSMIQHEMFFDQFPREVTPVAVEVRPNSESLYDFVHPENPLYVFGPEDGSIPSMILSHCHRFVVIPTKHCLNLATAVATMMWDRSFKLWMDGRAEMVTPGEHERRGFCQTEIDNALQERGRR